VLSAIDSDYMEEELPLLTLANMESRKIVTTYFIKYLNDKLGAKSPTAQVIPDESFYETFKQEVNILSECGWIAWFDSEFGCTCSTPSLSLRNLTPNMPLDNAIVVGKVIVGEIDMDNMLYRLMCHSHGEV